MTMWFCPAGKCGAVHVQSQAHNLIMYAYSAHSCGYCIFFHLLLVQHQDLGVVKTFSCIIVYEIPPSAPVEIQYP